MSKVLGVIWDLGGVVVSSPVHAIRAYEARHQLPPLFFYSVMSAGGADSSFSRLERGELMLSSFLSIFQRESVDAYHQLQQNSAPTFDVRELFASMHKEAKIVPEMLSAIATVRNAGYRTGLLTNNWIDDVTPHSGEARLFLTLKHYFDDIVESSRVGLRKPDAKIYELACRRLDLTPDQTVFLDDLGPNLSAARALGMQTFRVKDPVLAAQDLLKHLNLKESPIQRSIGRFAGVYPPAVRWSELATRDVKCRDNVTLRTYTLGHGPAVVLVHGFPDLAISFRYQIAALSQAGYMAIAVDMRGYGQSSKPADPVAYSLEKVTEDLKLVLDAYSLPEAVFFGHDWGGSVVWEMARQYPGRVKAVASLCTPFFPVAKSDPYPKLMSTTSRFDYQAYFHNPQAKTELEKDVARTVAVIIRGYDEKLPTTQPTTTSNVRERGGFLVGFPLQPPKSKFMSDEVFAYYISSFQRGGFAGPLAWYQNVSANWKFSQRCAGQKIKQPALMITCEHDDVLVPAAAAHMEDYCENLSRSQIASGHFAQQERPHEVNDALLQWLKKLDLQKSKL